MAIVKLQNSTTTVNAGQANTTYLVGANVTIVAAQDGIDMLGDAKYRTLKINGAVEGGYAGLYVDAQPAPFGGAKISIGETGSVSGGDRGMVVWGQGHTINNAGEISGDKAGAEFYGTNRTVNSGTIHGDITGMQLFSGPGDGFNVVVNSGVISGGEYAITASFEYEKIINTGKIIGDVGLGSGDDTFVFKAGQVLGDVEGGLGDDTYIVNKAGLDISELFNEGMDKIYSSVSIEMPANVEKLYLTGKGDLSATGGTNGNWIYGNAGANKIDGAGGMDYIDGGKGNDVLTGGSSSDDFHFARGTGRDIVTDFEAGFDEIQLGDLKGAQDFTDMLENHVAQKGGDVWISYGHDVVVLKDTVIADLKGGDFDFG